MFLLILVQQNHISISDKIINIYLKNNKKTEILPLKIENIVIHIVKNNQNILQIINLTKSNKNLKIMSYEKISKMGKKIK